MADDWTRMALELHRAGSSIEQISAALKQPVVEVEGAIAAYTEERRRALTSSSELIREIDQLDALHQGLWRLARGGDVKAVAQVTRLMQRRSELVGSLRRMPAIPSFEAEPVDLEVPENASWYRQDGESSKAFTAFGMYRDAGPGRTLSQAWRDYAEANGLGQRVSEKFRAWSKQHSWVDRCRDYDNFVTKCGVGRSLDVIEGARRQYLAAADDAAYSMIQMMNGHNADHARIAAAKDILDRVGFVRQRASAPGNKALVSASAQNMQVNMDLTEFSMDELMQLASALKVGTE